MVGGVKSHLELNPIPIIVAQRAQTNLVHTRPRDPTETETELCLRVSCGDTWTAAGAGLWVQQTWLWHKHSWRRSPLTHNRAIRTHTGLGNRLLEGTNRILCAPGLFEPSEHLWRLRGLIINTNPSLLPSCWGFSALGCGVSPHSRSSTVQLLLQPRVAESYVTKFRQLRTLWGVLKNYYFYYFSKSNKFSLVKKGTESAV